MFDRVQISLNDKLVWVHPDVAEYIRKLELRNTNQKLRFEEDIRMLKGELETIKPVLETPKLKEAVSEHCGSCRFAVISRWNRRDILGCMKGLVCDDYSPEEE